VQRTLSAPAAAARFLPDLDRLCVSGDGEVHFYDGGSLAPAGTMTLQSSLDELQYDAKAKRLYVGMMDPDKPGIAVIAVRGRRLLAKLKLPAKPQGFVVEPDAARIYVNTPREAQVTVLDLKTRSVAAEWKLRGARSNFPIALDRKNHRLFVACRRPARLLVLDAASGNAVAGIEIGGDADDMSFDPAGKWVYVACGAGVISTVEQLDADHYRKHPDTPTANDARNSLFVDELKTFFIAVPPQGSTPAQLRAYRARD
jgi:DNA-binding beta-propeller fold protein YncE